MSKTALYPTTCNPPTFGFVLGLRYIEDLYEKIFVCIQDDNLIIPTTKIVYMLEKVLAKGNSKYAIITNKADFTRITTLPRELPVTDVVITPDTRIYSNLKGKGHENVILIPRPLGWDETFHRTAYERSLILDNVNSTVKTSYDPEKYVNENIK